MLGRWRQLAVAVAVALVPAAASADLLQSTHFRLNPDVADTFGGIGSSTHYQLTDAGGETAVGAGSSGSYRLSQGYVASLTQAIQLSVLPSGTYAYWPLDTGTGIQAYDVSLNNDQATLVNNPSWGTGIIGQSISLNGSNQYAYTARSVTAPAAYTLELWFKTTTSSGGRLFGFGSAQTGTSATLDRMVYMNNSGQLVYGVSSSGNKTVATTASYNDGSWHHVAASLGSAGIILYVDGVKQSSDASVTSAASYSGYWRLGFDSLTGWPTAPTSNYFGGSLDEVRVVTRQESDTEVKNDYTAGANGLNGAFTIPNVTPGTSQTYNVDAVVLTDAGGYNLLIQRPSPLLHTDGTTVLPDISGSIASPIAWVEGTTKGFGFSVIGGTLIESKWGSSPNYDYAALPTSATVYHSRTGGLAAGVPESTTIQYRVDTAPSQKQGTYSTQVVYTATLKP